MHFHSSGHNPIQPSPKKFLVAWIWGAFFLSSLVFVHVANSEELLSVTADQTSNTQPPPGSEDDSGNLGSWRYPVLPEDTIWSISNAYLSDRYTWVDLIRFNHLKNAGEVKDGLMLFIPFKWMKLQPAPAIALAVNGDVLLKRSQQLRWVTLEKDFYLHVGDTIKTFKGSVLVKFADNSVLRLEDDTVLVFNRLTQFGKSGMTDTGLRLEKGRVSTKVKPNTENGSRYEITTPSAVAAVRGTEFRVDADSDATGLEVVEGVVEFSVRDHKIEVPAGYAVTATKDQRLSQPEKLLPAPSAVSLPANAESLPVNFEWQTLANASIYRYAIYEDSLQGSKLRSEIINEPRLQLNNLANGNYIVTLRGITSEGIEGLDARHALHIGVNAQPAILVSPLPDQVFNQVQPTFRWHDLNKTQQASLEIAQSPEFNPVIVQTDYINATYTNLDFILPPGTYYWRVRTVAGTSSEALSESRSLGIRGILENAEIITVNYHADRAKVFWKSVPNADTYIVQMSDTNSFEKIIRQESTTSPNIGLRLKPDESYYIRVKPVGSDLFTSSFGPGKEIRLTD